MTTIINRPSKHPKTAAEAEILLATWEDCRPGTEPSRKLLQKCMAIMEGAKVERTVETRHGSVPIKVTRRWLKMGDHPEVQMVPTDRPLWQTLEGQVARKCGFIVTPQGPRIVAPGDLIGQGVDGNYYHSKPNAYEAVGMRRIG